MKVAFDVYAPPYEIEGVISRLVKFNPEDKGLMELIRRSEILLVCGGCKKEWDPENPIELMMIETMIVLRRVGEDGKLVSIPTIWRIFFCKHCVLKVINFDNTDVSLGGMYL